MKAKRLRYIGLGFLMLIGVSVCCIIAAYGLNKLHIDAQENIQTTSSEIQYGEQGLPKGETLSEKPVKVTEDYLYYTDRTVEVYQNKEEEEENIARVLNKFMTALPQEIHKYVMIVPPRISYETGVEDYTKNPLTSIQSIYSSLSKDINVISLESTLRQHQNEYIYYRTEPEWTSLGAYYGAMDFCKEKGFSSMNISNYREEKYIEYIGSYYQLPNNCIEGEKGDYVAFFIPRNGENKETIKVRKSEDNYQLVKNPTVCLSRQGTDIFVGGNFSYSVLEGDKKEGKTLLLLADSNGKILSPWLTSYYKSIYLINIKWYQEGEEGIRNVLKNYDVDDVLITVGLDKDNNTLVYPRLDSYVLD